MDRAKEANNPEMLKGDNNKKVPVFPKDQEQHSKTDNFYTITTALQKKKNQKSTAHTSTEKTDPPDP